MGFWSVAGLAAVAVAMLPTAEAHGPLQPSCTFDPDAHSLVIDSPGEGDGQGVRLTRGGDEIVVLERKFPERPSFEPLECDGGTPTVSNTDRVDVQAPDGLSWGLQIKLGGGGLAPGFTNEGDGSSEIEIYFAETEGSFSAFAIVRGSAGDDSVDFGSVGGDMAANLNADETVPDPDVFLSDAFGFDFTGRDGDDRASAMGGPGFDGPIGSVAQANDSFAIRLVGGFGADDLTGTPGAEAKYGTSIDGGDGPDRLVGGPDRDSIRADFGRDTILGRGGDDQLVSQKKPSDSDQVACGGGTDEVRADKQDQINSDCERTILPD